MAYQNLNKYNSEGGVEKPKVIVESVKSDSGYIPLWINDVSNKKELERLVFSRNHLNDETLNSVFSMTEEELQDLTEIVMRVVNNLYGDSISQQLGLTDDKTSTSSAAPSNSSVNLEEAIRKWNINDYMTMGNSYPYNCVFNLMESVSPPRSTDRESEFEFFSQSASSTTNSAFDTITNESLDRIDCCHHLQSTESNREAQTTDNDCREKPLVSLEVTTFANGKFAKISGSNNIKDDSCIQKTKLFFTFTEYQKLVNVLRRMAAIRTETITSEKSKDTNKNESSCNINGNYTNNETTQSNYNMNVQNLFAYINTIKNSNVNSKTSLLNQKYCSTIYTSTNARKSNAFDTNFVKICPRNEPNETYNGQCQKCTKTSANANLKSKNSQTNSRKSKENLPVDLTWNKQSSSCECINSENLLPLSMIKHKNLKRQPRKKESTETRKNKTNLKSQRDKPQSGSVQKKALTTQSTNVRAIPLAPKGSQRMNKKSNTEGIIRDETLENTTDVVKWIEKYSDSFFTVETNKSVNEVKKKLLSKNEKDDNNNKSQNKFLININSDTKNKIKNDTNNKKDNKETNIFKKNCIAHLFKKAIDNNNSIFNKNQSENPKVKCYKNKANIEREITYSNHTIKCQKIVSKKDLCIENNKSNPTTHHNVTIRNLKDSTKYDNKPNTITDRIVSIPNPKDSTKHDNNEEMNLRIGTNKFNATNDQTAAIPNSEDSTKHDNNVEMNLRIGTNKFNATNDQTAAIPNSEDSTKHDNNVEMNLRIGTNKFNATNDQTAAIPNSEDSTKHDNNVEMNLRIGTNKFNATNDQTAAIPNSEDSTKHDNNEEMNLRIGTNKSNPTNDQIAAIPNSEDSTKHDNNVEMNLRIGTNKSNPTNDPIMITPNPEDSTGHSNNEEVNSCIKTNKSNPTNDPIMITPNPEDSTGHSNNEEVNSCIKTNKFNAATDQTMTTPNPENSTERNNNEDDNLHIESIKSNAKTDHNVTENSIKHDNNEEEKSRIDMSNASNDQTATISDIEDSTKHGNDNEANLRIETSDSYTTTDRNVIIPNSEDSTKDGNNEEKNSCMEYNESNPQQNPKENNDQRSYRYNLRKRKPIVYFFPSEEWLRVEKAREQKQPMSN